MTDRPPPDVQGARTRARAGIKRKPEPVDALDLTRRRRIVSELEEVRRALVISRRETKAACRKLQALRNDNARLELELVALAREESATRALAYQDELTGLPNRRLLKDRLCQALARSARQDTQVALLLLDLDDFKGINDSLGHAAGDLVLRMVAERLSGGIRDADTACRYGGDEFVVMLPDIEDATIAANVVKKLRGILGMRYVVGDFEIRMTASVGIVVYPDDGDSDVELFRKADIALYSAKNTNEKVSITNVSRYGSIEISSADLLTR